MARDKLKEAIELGKQIPAHKSHVSTTTKETKFKKIDLTERPKQSQMVRAIRTLNGVRK